MKVTRQEISDAQQKEWAIAQLRIDEDTCNWVEDVAMSGYKSERDEDLVDTIYEMSQQVQEDTIGYTNPLIYNQLQRTTEAARHAKEAIEANPHRRPRMFRSQPYNVDNMRYRPVFEFDYVDELGQRGSVRWPLQRHYRLYDEDLEDVWQSQN